MLGRRLTLRAEVVDSAGQVNLSADRFVTVVSEPVVHLPELVFEQPTEFQRFVERSPIRYQIAVPSDGEPSGIESVDYFVDGAPVGSTSFAANRDARGRHVRGLAPGQHGRGDQHQRDHALGARGGALAERQRADAVSG